MNRRSCTKKGSTSSQRHSRFSTPFSTVQLSKKTPWFPLQPLHIILSQHPQIYLPFTTVQGLQFDGFNKIANIGTENDKISLDPVAYYKERRP